MRYLLSLLACTFGLTSLLHAAEPFEINDGDRVLFLGDTLLEREGTYGYLETQLQEEYPDRHFIVRNLAFSADTPLGWSRASFDPVGKGFDRLKEQLDLVKPTVVFLGYGMAASLQEMTDRSGDPTLNPDPVRYGTEPMSAERFKKELGQLMDTIVEENKSFGGAGVRFVLLSPIRHEDLRKFKPGLPDPTPHNLLLTQYSKVISELAQERSAHFVSLGELASVVAEHVEGEQPHLTENGIHLTEFGYATMANVVSAQLGETPGHAPSPTLRKAIIHKNELFFHRWRPANSTYLFGFRKHEQGQNAKEIPEFDPLIAAADAAVDEMKQAEAHPESAPAVASIPATKDLPAVPPLPKPEFTLDNGLQIELWAENPLLFKPTEMNWDPQGRLWVAIIG